MPVPARAQARPEGGSPIEQLAFRHPDLFIFNDYKGVDEVAPALATQLQGELDILGVGTRLGFFDVRTGRWGTLIQGRPLIPGSGVGNLLEWEALGLTPPADSRGLGSAAFNAFTQYLTEFQTQLRIQLTEVSSGPDITVHEQGGIVQISAPRVVLGVPVRDSYVTATLNSGNLVLLGTRNWGDLAISTQPAVSEEGAITKVQAHVEPQAIDGFWRKAQLVILPFEKGDNLDQVAVGQGLSYRLAWAVNPSFAGDNGSWEGLVDAQTGELLAFSDQNQYANRKVVGGVFPVSNDGLAPGGIPDGIEQPGWPMPFADILVNGADPTFTNSAGNLFCVDGEIETALSGKFVRMSDRCGEISEVAASGDLDLGTSGGTDCTVPAGHSAGDTHSSRTGFYEVNRIKEKARSWLPDNVWLKEQLTANMNIDNECNAFWNGSSINFYRNKGNCRNTGEIAAVFDHEWGHGMDANDAHPGISVPGEAPADIYAMARLNTSCIGRGFFLSGFCGGNGDPCTECTGVRDADWMKRSSGLPHDIDWIMRLPASTGVPGVEPPGGCPAAVQTGPCGRSTHCEGSVVSEVIWDLIHRDLRGFEGSPFNLDVNTSLNLVTRLHYLGGGNVNLWFTCTPPFGGCNADGGYLNYLAVDDDNGNLEDGTPHMTAIFSAFNRHQMACPMPTPTNSGCATGPATAPAVTATALDNGARVRWNAVPNAEKYWVFRTDGIHGCAFGKERLAITSKTEFVDTEVLNGREYFYTVEAVGSNDSCRSPASTCVSVVPSSAGAGVNLRLVEGSQAFAGLTGDGDPFLDNCEHGRISFVVQYSGNQPLSNVRIVNVESISHPDIEITSTFPIALAATLADCARATGSFTIRAAGLSFDDTVRFRVDLTSDELFGEGVVRSEIVELGSAESDFQFQASKKFTFDSTDLNDFEGWKVARGTYTKNPGGAESSPFYLASSAAQDDACDEIRSPLIRLSAASTLSLFNQFSIEPPLPVFGNVFYDRANVGIFDVESGTRTPVAPDGGRLYNASGPNGTCVTTGQPGWAGVGAGFEESSWSAAALQSAGFAGRIVRLDVAYGTDPLLSGTGFWFDQVALTNFDLQVPDQQSDICEPEPCNVIDDSDAAVDYRGGWHRKNDPAASFGSYHRRLGSKTGTNPAVRLVFTGNQLTYFYAKSDIGGTADIFIDGRLLETLSYGAPGQANPIFGHSRTYTGLGAGTHTLVIEHRAGAVYVDGFGFACAEGASADPAGATFHSMTETSTASATEGVLIERSVVIGASDTEISVVVEGSQVPLTVNLVDPLGNLVATGGALISGLTASGLDAPVSGSGTYRVQVVNVAGAFDTVEMSTARTVRVK